jgi:hypothetical protein
VTVNYVPVSKKGGKTKSENPCHAMAHVEL